MSDASFVTSLAFAALLLAAFCVQFLLLTRQIRHVHAHRNEVPKRFADAVNLSAHQKAADYTVAKAKVSMLELTFGTCVVLGWTLLGGLDSLNLFTLQWMEPGISQQLLLMTMFVLLGAGVEMPWSAWQTFGVEARYGFNHSTVRMWLGDQVKSAILGLLLMLPLAALALWVLSATGNWGWFWLWLLLMAFGLVMMVVAPIWIAPLFNQFQPLSDPALAEKVNNLMLRCGFHSSGVFVMDGSRRSAHANAYFTGLGRSKRVVLYDTLLKQLSAQELESVLAHELGHFHHKHVVKRMAGMALQTLVGLLLLGWLSGQAWFYSGLGVTPPLLSTQPALAVLLFLLAAPAVSVWLTPWQAAWSRRHEYEADAYAAAHASGPALQSALVKLHRDNAATLTPDPLYVRFHHSHPSALDRVAQLEPS